MVTDGLHNYNIEWIKFVVIMISRIVFIVVLIGLCFGVNIFTIEQVNKANIKTLIICAIPIVISGILLYLLSFPIK